MLVSSLAAPFLTAILLALLPSLNKRSASWVAGIGTALSLLLLLTHSGAVFDGGVPVFKAEWMPSIGLAFSLRLDGFAFVFAGLVLGIGLLVVLYAGYYLHKNDPPSRFFAFLMFFMGAMLGITLSGNILLLAIFWELTSLSSFLLIGYWYHRSDARRGARMALAITGAGGLCLLAGVILLGQIVGSYELEVILPAGEQIRAHPLYTPALLLILMGAFTKSAQFPFHFWLPHAMAAPTPVSAYLHSATMVKAGVFLLARFYPALAGSELWFYTVTSVGLATLLVGAYFAIFQQDLKGLLAYSTISHLGLITLLFGLNTPMATVAGVFHILNHATFKASLFMAAGIIDHETGTRDFRKLSGLWRYMPYTGALAIVASLAMAGVPLFNGFLSKEMFLEQTLRLQTIGPFGYVVPAIALVASICAVAYSLRFIYEVFFDGEPKGLKHFPPHEPPRFMKVPVEILVVLCVAVGLAPNLTIAPLLKLAAGGVLLGELPVYKLAIWHGFNSALVMSILALIGGVVLYWVLHKGAGLKEIERASRAKQIYDANMQRIVRGARSLTLRLENGVFARYALYLALCLLAVAAYTGMQSVTVGPVPMQPIDPIAVLLLLTVCVGSAGVVWAHRRRVMAILMLGAVGLAVSMMFVMLSAPDLALTQLLIEIASIVLLLLGLRFLPQVGRDAISSWKRWRDGAISIGIGGFVAWVSWLILTRPSQSISQYFLETALPQAGGSNAVNVIIVDYRAFDTLGEITVYGIAALVIYNLLTGLSAHAQRAATPERPSLLLTRVSGLLLPAAIVISFYMFLRGHNQPGGGFIAGLILAIPFVVQYMALGRERFEEKFAADWHRWIGVGLVIAGIAGVGSYLFGHPLLTSSTPHVKLPLIGEIHLPSAAIFDTGVYLVVFGGTMLMLVMLIRIRALTAPARQGT